MLCWTDRSSNAVLKADWQPLPSGNRESLEWNASEKLDLLAIPGGGSQCQIKNHKILFGWLTREFYGEGHGLFPRFHDHIFNIHVVGVKAEKVSIVPSLHCFMG